MQLDLSSKDLFYFSTVSWGDILDKTIWDEGFRVGYGFIVMIFYVGFMLGKFNMVEQRVLEIRVLLSG